jgi:hypothetical protein
MLAIKWTKATSLAANKTTRRKPPMLRKIYNAIFRKATQSIDEVVALAFPGRDQSFARAFYESWSGEYLLVQLGDGDHELFDAEAFFRSAFFVFNKPPWKINGDWLLGMHAEDEAGMIVLERETGNIVYAYERRDPDTDTELAASFTEFLVKLRKAGWGGPNDGNPAS